MGMEQKQDNETLLPLVTVGYDFRRASAKWRSYLVLNEEEQSRLFQRLENSGMVNGIVFLNTCNRNEIIASSANPQWAGQIIRAQILNLLKQRSGQEKVPEPFVYAGSQAVIHILRTAAGLESFVQGERQIAGQMNQAFMDARKKDRSSVTLNGLNSLCGRSARETAAAGFSAQSLRGVHDLAVRFLQRKFFDLQVKKNVVVVGYGEIGRLVIDSLHYHTSWPVKIANRTVYADKKEQIHSLSELPALVAESDVLVVCSGASEPVITGEILAGRKQSGLTIVDLGIPVQTAASCKNLPGVELADLDVLMDSGLLDQGDPMVEELVKKIMDSLHDDFVKYCREREMINILNTTQTQHTRYVQEIIPLVLKDEFPELPEDTRSRLIFRLRGLMREYTNSIINSVHDSAENKNTDKDQKATG